MVAQTALPGTLLMNECRPITSCDEVSSSQKLITNSVLLAVDPATGLPVELIVTVPSAPFTLM